jgi:hypothetical protein
VSALYEYVAGGVCISVLLQDANIITNKKKIIEVIGFMVSGIKIE